MRIGIISLIHESNTFICTPTTYDMFEANMLIGDALIKKCEKAQHEITGFIAVLREHGHEPVPIFSAFALPTGTITRETCERLIETILAELGKSGPLDGLLVAPHGANSGADEYHDLDGVWLGRVREAVGDIPIVCTVDPHCNLSPAMVEACNATIGYRSNPHLDQLVIGTEAATLLLRTLAGEVNPVQAAAFPPVQINIERQHTPSEPCRSLYKLADEILKEPGVLSNSILLGFPYTDAEEMGSSFVVVTDGDRKLAQAKADQLAAYLVEHRALFAGEFIEPEDAVEMAAQEKGPVCLLDMGDNAGGGSAADGTILAALLRKQKTPSFVCLYDPESVRACIEAGPGATLNLRCGGKTDDLHGEPLEVTGTVRSLHDGYYTESEIRHGGRTEENMGDSAVFDCNDGLTLLLTSLRSIPVSLGMMTSCGLHPSEFQVVVAKGVIAPMAAYEPVCTKLIRVNTPGTTCADMRKFDYKHRRRPLYPLDELPTTKQH